MLLKTVWTFRCIDLCMWCAFEVVLTAAEWRRRVWWISAVVQLRRRLGQKQRLVMAADQCRSLGQSQPHIAAVVTARWHAWLTSVEMMMMMTMLPWRSLVNWKWALHREWTASHDGYASQALTVLLTAVMTVGMLDWRHKCSQCYWLLRWLLARWTGVTSVNSITDCCDDCWHIGLVYIIVIACSTLVTLSCFCLENLISTSAVMEYLGKISSGKLLLANCTCGAMPVFSSVMHASLLYCWISTWKLQLGWTAAKRRENVMNFAVSGDWSGHPAEVA